MRCNFRYAQCILGCMMMCLPLLAAAKERIVTLSPALNEIVFALGSGKDVVATTTYANYPEAARKLPKVGGYFSPSLERIVAMRPTLVLMQADNHKLLSQLKKLHIRTVALPIDTIKHILATVETLGERLHQSRQAENITRTIRNALRRLHGIVTGKKILFVIGQPTDLKGRIFVVGRNLYLHDIITLSGNKNAVPSHILGQPIFSRENLIAANPDIVVILAPFMKERGLSQTALIKPWLHLPIEASKEGDIYVIGKSYAGIPSQRIVYFINDFIKILHAVNDKRTYR